MTATNEILVNIKNFMQRWFSLTTEMNSAINNVEERIDDVALEIFKKTGVIDKLEACSTIIDFETVVHNDLQILGMSYEGWLSENGVEECILYAVDVHGNYDNDTVFIVLDHFYFYDSAEGTVSLLNDYDVDLEASSYNVNINGSVTLTATLTDQLGNPIPYKNVEIYKNGSSLSQGITNNKGILMFTVTCNAEGLITFSAGNASIQVNCIYDTGWVYGNVNPKWMNSNWIDYDSNNSIRVRRVGKVVHFEGTAKPQHALVSTNETVTIGTLPSQFRPNHVQRFVMQGSGKNTWVLSFAPNGIIGFARYGTTQNTTMEVDSWMNMYATWMVD